MKKAFVNLIHTLLNIVLPRQCAGCGLENEVFCKNCSIVSYQKGAQCLICGIRNKDGKTCREHRILNQILWAGSCDNALRKTIWQLKYRGRKELAAPLAKLLYKKFQEIFFETKSLRGFVAIPIPLHFKKEYERGFNQTELLAKEFSRLSNIPLLANTLLKVKETPAQVETPNKELRIKNLEKAFRINPKISKSDLELLASGSLILIDDVATTGSTLFHAASTLRAAGAKNIIGLVVAHGS